MPNTVNVCIAALRFLFETTLQRPEVMGSVRVCRRPLGSAVL